MLAMQNVLGKFDLFAKASCKIYISPLIKKHHQNLSPAAWLMSSCVTLQRLQHSPPTAFTWKFKSGLGNEAAIAGSNYSDRKPSGATSIHFG